MARTVSIGKQDFEKVIMEDCFYIDKTGFIKEWWENKDEVTLITRPRRFGKTLNMSMLNCFFSNKYADRGDLFEGLQIWEDEKYQEIQGTYPVIFLSFAGIKSNNFKDTKNDIVAVINNAYRSYSYLLESDVLSEAEKEIFKGFDEYANNINVDKEISNETVYRALNNLSLFLNRYYGKKVIILLDEYDTPMQEAYVNGYWEELVSFTRSLFNWTFKTNPYLERAIMTGITRVSKESIFSDLNNLVVVTTTSKQYETSFGFTEREVFLALDEQGLSDQKEKVKRWYDGFIFGESKDIYNPWSIINYLKTGEFATYWADSSSNGLINSLVKTGSSYIKMMMETLLRGETIEVPIDEQIVFSELDYSEDAVWSLMLASGYLKVISSDKLTGDRKKSVMYKLALTNFEIKLMFENMVFRWFNPAKMETNEFIKALIGGDIESMNDYMNDVALKTFSSFDSGKKTSSKKAPENFFHGFVLGLMVDQSENYIITSNRESGYGRYDILLEPKDKHGQKYPGIVIEFKVINQRKEKSLEETVEAALKQIEEKNYDTELINRGVKKENIHHYGFAFKGKEVLIDGR
ncbi:ATP-binding protein [Eubacterium sp. MSJ-13]|uniref:AAA family ATPase n=1 Tax=Eubacterium sp. MSJ-13 TaxID=2841513 RepID=UPI001C109DF7|nr:AAA family ATPase [Eubacterium sp. MSJ-13]MBU5479454.1 ATP-binding protein [Eubacterium sp. MSJ-13]